MLRLATPHLGACETAGGALGRVATATDAIAPEWAAGTWAAGKIVLDRAQPTDPWTVYIATADHTSVDPAPSTGANGWLALSAAPTQVPVWVQGDDYAINQPVRIDMGGVSRIFMATRAVVNSQDSPDSQAGQTVWNEIGVQAPPPALPWDANIAYRLGDLVQHLLGTLWVATAATNAGDRPGVVGTPWSKVSA